MRQIDKKSATLVATLAGIFVLTYIRHRKERTKADITPEELQEVEAEAHKSAEKAVRDTLHASSNRLATRVSIAAVRLLRKNVRQPDP